MSKQELQDLMQNNHSSSEEDQNEGSINNLNKQLKEFQHKFKGYYMQKPFSDSDSEEEVTAPTFHAKQPNSKKQEKQEPSRLVQIKNQIKWKDPEIQQLLKLEGDGTKDKKIKELAQKVKLLSIALEKEKNNKKKQASDLLGTKTSNTPNNNDLKKSIRQGDEGDLKNKLVQTQKQIMEMRLKNQNLKNQLNKAMRVISKEIGEDANIDDILSQENAWKGRQQKIQHLKGKVKQLESKLSSNGVNVSHMSGFTMMSYDKTSKQQTTINNMTENRRKEMENLQVQIQAMKSQNQILQGKVKALASRKGTVETQIRELKSQFQKKEKLFKEKSENDDKYISLLKAENQKLKKEKEDKVVTKLVYKNSDSSQANNLKKEVERLKSLLCQKQKEWSKVVEQLKIRQKPKSREQIRPQSKEKKVIQKKIQELQRQYIDEEQVDKSLTAQEEEVIYKQWKQNKLKGGK